MATIKTAVSLPKETYEQAESIRRKQRKSRSKLYADALKAYMKALEIHEMEERYVAGYKKYPETAAEIAEARAWAKLSAQALEPEDWSKEWSDWKK